MDTPADLPPAWDDLLDGWRPVRVRHGQTDAAVWRLTRKDAQPRYLKLAECGDAAAALRREAAKLVWLRDRRAPVPRLIAVFDDADKVAVLTEALPGHAATAAPFAPAVLVDLLGQGLKRFHATPLAGWPFENADAARLEAARARLAGGAVDPAQFGEDHRHLAPKALFARLADKPPGEPVLTHGDADLANVLVTSEGDVGFVDCGDAGPADPYLDLFEMAESIAATLGAAHLPVFFAAYGIDLPDPDRLAYYARLDEFF